MIGVHIWKDLPEGFISYFKLGAFLRSTFRIVGNIFEILLK